MFIEKWSKNYLKKINSITEFDQIELEEGINYIGQFSLGDSNFRNSDSDK
tara:strand:+ start:547 stop:696 length:150 start_codon:yes stop_codon:yes gene_type:complete